VSLQYSVLVKYFTLMNFKTNPSPCPSPNPSQSSTMMGPEICWASNFCSH